MRPPLSETVHGTRTKTEAIRWSVRAAGRNVEFPGSLVVDRLSLVVVALCLRTTINGLRSTKRKKPLRLAPKGLVRAQILWNLQSRECTSGERAETARQPASRWGELISHNQECAE